MAQAEDLKPENRCRKIFAIIGEWKSRRNSTRECFQNTGDFVMTDGLFCGGGLARTILAICILALSLNCALAPDGMAASQKGKKTVVVQEGWPLPPPPGSAISVTDTIYGVLRHHRALRSMQENRQVLEHEVRRAQAGFGPSVDISGQAGGNLLSDRSTRNEDLDKQMYGIGEISGRLTQPLFDGFASRSRVRSALSTLNSVKARVFDTATTLALDGIIAHIDLLRQRQIYELSERNVSQHRAILDMTQDRTSMGADTEADVTQAQSRLSRALSSLSEAQAALLVAEDTYTRLTGMAPPAKLDPVAMPPETFSGPGKVIELAEKHNPKILAYIQDIRTATGDKELAESTFYPTINAEVGPTYTDRGGSYDRWVYNFDAVATMRWNVFNSGADVAERKAAMARIRQARQTMYDFFDTLKLDIESTWVNYLSAQDQYKHYTDAVKSNEFTRTAFVEQFQLGKRSLLDVLDAENELYNSSTQAATASSNILVGAYRLCALAGNMLPVLSIYTKPLNENPAHDKVTKAEEFDMGWFK